MSGISPWFPIYNQNLSEWCAWGMSKGELYIYMFVVRIKQESRMELILYPNACNVWFHRDERLNKLKIN